MPERSRGCQQTPQCVVEAKGDPQLVELKGDNGSFDLTGRGC
jgi:hypothetical protein